MSALLATASIAISVKRLGISVNTKAFTIQPYVLTGSVLIHVILSLLLWIANNHCTL